MIQKRGSPALLSPSEIQEVLTYIMFAVLRHVTHTATNTALLLVDKVFALLALPGPVLR